jgi:hypothetical protein
MLTYYIFTVYVDERDQSKKFNNFLPVPNKAYNFEMENGKLLFVVEINTLRQKLFIWQTFTETFFGTLSKPV